MTIVMYHYVRNLKASRYPGIKGLDFQHFKRQIKLLNQTHTIITIEECLEFLNGTGEINRLPENAALLTFDDGYLEHFTEVFPFLDEMGLQGSFFPPVVSTTERKVLDVNKIHFVLASSVNPKYLLRRLSESIAKYQKEYELMDPEIYFRKIDSVEHPYDPLEVIIFKRVLQRELPYEVRSKIVSELFHEFVNVKEEVFAEELYMKESHLKCMLKHGMHVGGHGYSHEWLNRLTVEQQINETDKMRDFLEVLGVDKNSWVMCYPYGAYDSSMINILKERNCALGLTTGDAKADLVQEKRYRLNRIDTNEI